MYLLVSMSPLKMVSKTMNKKGNIALFYFAAPSSAAVLIFYKISCLFHFITHLAYRINALQKDVIFIRVATKLINYMYLFIGEKKTKATSR